MGDRTPDEQAIIAAAKAEHDRVCSCDPRYLMSCGRMAEAILAQGGRRSGQPDGQNGGQVSDAADERAGQTPGTAGPEVDGATDAEGVTPTCPASAYCAYDDEADCELRAGHADEWHQETRRFPAVGGSLLGEDEVVIRWRRVP